MQKFPFISLKSALIILRVSLALIFLAHSIVRIFNGTIPRFADYLTNWGMPAGYTVVILLTVFEVAGGILLLAGLYKKWVSAGFILLLLSGILIIHAGRGWFVGEHGSGGCEYSFILIIGFLVIAADDQTKLTNV